MSVYLIFILDFLKILIWTIITRMKTYIKHGCHIEHYFSQLLGSLDLMVSFCLHSYTLMFWLLRPDAHRTTHHS